MLSARLVALHTYGLSGMSGPVPWNARLRGRGTRLSSAQDCKGTGNTHLMSWIANISTSQVDGSRLLSNEY